MRDVERRMRRLEDAKPKAMHPVTTVFIQAAGHWHGSLFEKTASGEWQSRPVGETEGRELARQINED